MTLRADLNAGLASLNREANPPKLELDEAGWCHIPVPLPSSIISLANGQLMIEVKISPTGKFFSLISPLGLFEKKPGTDFLEALLQRQFYPDQVGAASFAIGVQGDHDRLVAVYHWMVETISPSEFSSLFQKFIPAIIGLINEVKDMAGREPTLVLIHPG